METPAYLPDSIVAGGGSRLSRRLGFRHLCVNYFVQPDPNFPAVRAGSSQLLGGLTAIDEKCLIASRTTDHGAQAGAIDDGDRFRHQESFRRFHPAPMVTTLPGVTLVARGARRESIATATGPCVLHFGEVVGRCAGAAMRWPTMPGLARSTSG